MFVFYVFGGLTSFPACFRFIRVGGYKLLNVWLTYARNSNNSPLLHQILLTLQHLPLKVDHLKQVNNFKLMLWSFSMWTLVLCSLTVYPLLTFQNNTAKLVKQLSKSSDNEGMVHSLCWLFIIVHCVLKIVSVFLFCFFFPQNFGSWQVFWWMTGWL